MTKKILLVAITLFSIALKTQSQTISSNITSDLNTMRDLSIRPYVSFIIPPFDIRTKAALPINLNIDAQYWFKTLADVRVGVNLGAFNGGTLGITYHLRDKTKNAKHKFVLSRSSTRTTETTTYFKARGDIRSIFGPALDVTLGSFGNGNGFYNRIDFGFDFQSFSRVWAKTDQGNFASSRNGWVSFKLQGVFANNQKTTGIGAVATIQASARPWKGVTFYAGLPMGILKTISELPPVVGIDEPKTISPIFAINLGASINLIQHQ
jgi:hypothetical protein